MSAIAVDEFTSLEAWRATLAEFVATLLFVFIGAGSVVATGALTNGELTAARLLVIALAHGFAIAILAYATANISGGHINPAVTFAAWLTKNISTARAMMFVSGTAGGCSRRSPVAPGGHSRCCGHQFRSARSWPGCIHWYGICDGARCHIRRWCL